MPQDLTDRQQEYLDFIRAYIQENESAPRLDEIAKHLGVASPTAHKALKTLQDKGYIYFGRDRISGFYIRLIEFVDVSLQVAEISVLGQVDQFGIVHDFPEKSNHFATLALQSNPKDLFALHVSGNLPIFNFVPHDILIMDQGRSPQVGDICLTIINENRILIQITGQEKKTGKLSWITIGEDDDNNPVITEIQDSQGSYPHYLLKEFIIATALRLTRHLAY